MCIFRGGKKTIAAILTLAVVLTMVFAPIYSQANDSSYKYEDVKVQFGTSYGMNYNSKHNPNIGGNNALGYFTNSYKYFTINEEGHYPAYCIESNVSVSGGKQFDIKETLSGVPADYQTAIKAIIDADLSSTNLGGVRYSDLDIGAATNATTTINNISVSMKEYCIKQYAIWYILDELGNRSDAWGPVKGLNACIKNPSYITAITDSEFSKTSNVYLTKSNLLNAVKYIKGLVDASMDSSSGIVPKEATFAFTDAITFTDTKDGYYTSNKIKAVATGNTEGNINYNNIKCKNINNENINYTSSSSVEGITIKILKTDVAPGTQVNVSIDANVMMKTKIYGYCDPEGEYQKLVAAIAEVNTSNINTSTSGIITRDIIKGKVEINKVDSEDTGLGLADAEFELSYTSDGAVITTTKSTIDGGSLEFENLPVGYNGEEIEYTLTETKAPEGYENFGLFTTTFVLTEDDRTKSFTTSNGNAITNNKIVYGAVDIVKIDSDDPDLYLEGAEFTLSKKLSGGAIATVTTGATDSDGYLAFENLDVYGYDNEKCEYILEETKAPEGYEEFDLFTTEFALTKADNTKSFTMSEASDNRILNTKKVYGQIDILKVDADDKSITLEGAEFTLYDATRNMTITTAATDVNGCLVIQGLDVYGLDGKGCSYVLTETKAPMGYESNPLNLFSQSFTLTSDEESLSMSFTVTNKKFAVAGEGADPRVLGDESTPFNEDNGNVLGEEAKTGDSVQPMLYLILILISVMAVITVFIIRKTRKND